MPVTFADQVRPESSIVTKSKRPKNTAAYQQRVPAWQPIYTAGTVVTTFFFIGIAFIPIGIGLLSISDTIMDKVIPYTNCTNEDGRLCKEIIINQKAHERNCFCNISFSIDTDWKGNVFIFYELSNFFQNHRRYLRSYDEHQLLGQLEPKEWGDIDKSCGNPYVHCNQSDNCCNGASEEGRCGNVVKNNTPYFPCGAMANSMFSDIISLKFENSDVEVIRTGIAWDSDKRLKFKNPPDCQSKGNETNECLKQKFKEFAKPVDWKRNLWELDTINPENNGLQNEDLILWMRPAAFSTFRKLYRKIHHTSIENHKLSPIFETGLPKGNYSFLIEYNFEVKSFNGTKAIVLTTLSALGNKTPFLAYAYIIVGSICVLLGIIFLIAHWKFGKVKKNFLHINRSTLYFEK